MTLLNNHQRCHVKKDTEIRLYQIDAKKRNDPTRRGSSSWDRGTNGPQV
jgi:endonuclease YncB( thermonuclease family)